MNDVNISSIDLNLLHVLAVVLEEGSATKAARRLRVTQSAVSSALRRLRALFGDPLVERRRNGFEPTPRARALQPRLREWSEQTRSVLEAPQEFDPERATRTFRVACTDAVATALLRPMLRLLRRRAPLASLQLFTLDALIAEDGLARGTVDLLIGAPPSVPADQRAELVYRDPWACIVREDHPSVRKSLSLDAFVALAHVELALFGPVDDTVDRALATVGQRRVVRVAVPHFSSIGLAVAESDGVATMSRRVARAAAEQLPLRLLAPPIELAPIEIRQVWHQRADADSAVRFLRALVRDAARPRSAR